MINLTSPKAIIFDWDNTLVNTWPIIHAALVATFREMGHEPWTLEQTKARVAKSMRDSFPEIFGARAQEAGDLYQRHYRSSHLKDMEPLEGAEGVLKRVKELELYCVVVSNKKGPTLREEVAHIGWNGYFSMIVGADDAARDKPFADPVHMAFEKSGMTPGRNVWFIGDSEVDLHCAQECSCTAILFGESAKTHPLYTHTHFHGFPYDAHVHSHEQVMALLAHA